LTEYYTSAAPIRVIAEASRTGPATNIIAGLAVGMKSAVPSVLMICAAIFVAYRSAGLYGNAVSAAGLPATVGITMPVHPCGCIPSFIAAVTMTAVGRAAEGMVAEVRRQFREIPGLMEGRAQPDSARCVDISTRAALREMIVPGLTAVLAPVVVGRWLGIYALGGMLAGATLTGVLLALFMANAGGAWDNAKKHIEAGAHGGKGSDPHRAAV